MSLVWFDNLPLLKLPDAPTEVELAGDTRLDGEDLDRFLTRGGTVKNPGYRVFIDGTVSIDALNTLVPANGGAGTAPLIKRSWRVGDRVRVSRGEHEDRTGTVSMLPSDPHAQYMQIGLGQVRVALDDEPGGTAAGPGARARGGRGGVPVNVAIDDLEPHGGPAGVATGKDRR